ncbi:MAG: exodeoxyribonuclease VII small subunit [Bacilli bacterium]|nr:exodeoxyribonuclease VII small subunit [Bacilli bacterium]
MEKEKKKFEDKIKELEFIISELENGNTSLEDSIDKYTKAMKLAKECDEELKKVEEKISKIVTDDGEVKDFEVTE